MFTAPPAEGFATDLYRGGQLDPTDQTIRLGQRPHPVPMNPVNWAVLQRCLTHHPTQRTYNLHLIVTNGTKAGKTLASSAYVSHVWACPRWGKSGVAAGG